MRGPLAVLAVMLLATAAMLGLVAARAVSGDYVVEAPRPTPSASASTLTLLGYCDRLGCVSYQQP